MFACYSQDLSPWILHCACACEDTPKPWGTYRGARKRADSSAGCPRAGAILAKPCQLSEQFPHGSDCAAQGICKDATAKRAGRTAERAKRGIANPLVGFGRQGHGGRHGESAAQVEQVFLRAPHRHHGRAAGSLCGRRGRVDKVLFAILKGGAGKPHNSVLELNAVWKTEKF